MAFKLPFKITKLDFEQAAKTNQWRGVANLLHRNFQAIEHAMRDIGHPNKRVFSFTATADRTTDSTTFVDWPLGETFTTPNYQKTRTPTRLIVTLMGSGYVTGTAGAVSFAVRVDGAGTDHVLRPNFFNATSDHQNVVGAVEISGVDAGTHTFTLRALSTSSGRTLHADTNDLLSLVVEEVL